MHQRIKEEFPNLNVSYSEKNALIDAGEVDIWIPSFKLAFEIQGPSHFEPIYGDEKLKSEKANDENKRNKAKELGIVLIEVDISKIKEFRKSIPFMIAVTKILDIIKNKINENAV